MENNNYVVWGTARMCIETVEEYESWPAYSFLQFSVAFATFKTRPWKRMKKSTKKRTNLHRRPKRRRNTLFNRSNENALREDQTKFHNYRGLDLIKLDRLDNYVRCSDAIVKTRYIIVLQRKIRKIIKNKRKITIEKYLQRQFITKNIPCDVWLTIVEFII